MITVYHEVAEDKIAGVLTQGLVLGAGGDKRNAAINKTDKFLNELRPNRVKQSGIDRETNIYCYLPRGNKLIDIASGELKTPTEITQRSGQALLRCNVEPESCYVSDLDLYDEIMELLNEDDRAKARERATTYWDSLTALNDYYGTFPRPEVMVIRPIPASALQRVC